MKALAIIGSAVLFSQTTAQADVKTWNTVSGSWDVSGNWLGGTPATSSTAVINNNGVVSVSSGVTGESMQILTGTSSGDGGTINIDGGVLSVSGTFSLGQVAGGSGSATITSGTLISTDHIGVGYRGSGTLTLDGGYISSSGGSIGGSLLGTASSVGDVTITSGTWEVATYFNVGDNGTGTLAVNGGRISAKDSYIGRVRGSEGKATVSSGTWVTTNNMYVASQGNGSLEVNGGNVAVSGTFYAGTSAAADVTVTSGTLSASSMFVGTGKTATVAVDGGLLTATDLSLGSNGSGQGTITVSSGTANVSSTLAIGVNGSGTVDISGGQVNAKTVIVASGTSSIEFGTGILRLSGSEGSRGILVAESIVKGADSTGTASVVFDGGIVRAEAQKPDLISNFGDGEVVIEDGGAYIDSNGHDIGITSSLSGTGALTKQGSGALTLTASNSYSGGTVVEAGAVIAAANHALGTGGVIVKNGTLVVQSGVEFTNAVSLEEGSFGRELDSGASLANAIDLNSSYGSVTTAAKIVDGTSSAEATVQGSFSSNSSALNDGRRLSNVFHLSGVTVLDFGTGETDMFVLQLQVADLQEGSFLGWLNPETNTWVNAVDGNIGGMAKFFEGAYDADTDFVLGYYGIDVANGTVWAVLNHNSDFAVIPEPGTWALLLFGGVVLLGWRKRRSTAQVL